MRPRVHAVRTSPHALRLMGVDGAGARAAACGRPSVRGEVRTLGVMAY